MKIVSNHKWVLDDLITRNYDVLICLNFNCGGTVPVH